MKFTIDIDTGGTFTDGFITAGNDVHKVKVETTPHDLTVCLLDLIKLGASKCGLTLPQFLAQTEVIRYSSTVGTNAIIQKSGPKVGLLVTAGYERSLYASSSVGQANAAHVRAFVPENMVRGLREQIDEQGKEGAPLNEQEVATIVEELLDLGAGIIAVSLLHSHVNPAHERQVKAIVNRLYPRHYLGSLPVLLASEVTPRSGEFARTNTVILSAYLRKDMIRYLYKADEDLRQAGYDKPLLIVHSDGGVARVAKTSVINTYNSGPAAGIIGASTIARSLYHLTDFVTVDVGGTSVDIGVVGGGQAALDWAPEVEGLSINVPMIKVEAIGGGGGAIVKARREDRKVTVGPESAGALPGPAAYDLGGKYPTLTDAALILGYLNPDYFLGGRRKLHVEKATQALQDHLAAPLGISVEEAARLAVETVEESIGRHIAGVISAQGHDPRDLPMLAYGGAGATHCCGYAAHVGSPRIYVFSFNPVFSAAGASTLDVVHIYECTVSLPLAAELSDGGRLEFNQTVAAMQDLAVRDMRGEGFGETSIAYRLELEVRANGQRAIVPWGGLALEEGDAARLRARAAECVGMAPQELAVEVLRLIATCPVPHYGFPTHPPAGENPAQALKGERPVFWREGTVATHVYERGLLACGNVVCGPAIVEAEDTTYVVPPGWRYTVDRFLNGVLEVA